MSHMVRRTLAGEALEGRLALTALVDSCGAIAPIDLVVEPADAIVQSAGGFAPEGEEDLSFVGPLEIDAYFASFGTSESEVARIEGEGWNQSAPPELLSFTATLSGNWWLLSGRVSDDWPPSGCHVFFDGILEGYSAQVSPDGSFVFSTVHYPGMYEIVNAVARDSNGNVSNSMSVVLGY